MKRAKHLVVFLAVMLCITACNKSKTPRFAEDQRWKDGSDSESIETSQPNDQVADSVSPTNDPTNVTSPSKTEDTTSKPNRVSVPDASIELYDTAVGNCVRLIVKPEIGDPTPGYGSGVVIAKDRQGYAYILTVWHAAKHGIQRVDFFSLETLRTPIASYESPEVVAELVRADLALLRVKVGKKIGNSPIRIAAASDELPKFGYSVGCGSGRSPSLLGERILSEGQIRPENSEMRARMWTTERPQEGGRSGGALLNAKGELLGIASKANDDGGYYSHIEEIRTLLADAKSKGKLP